jgi:hypothetical protein
MVFVEQNAKKVLIQINPLLSLLLTILAAAAAKTI